MNRAFVNKERNMDDRCETCRYYWTYGSMGDNCHHYQHHEVKPCGYYECIPEKKEDNTWERYERYQKEWN